MLVLAGVTTTAVVMTSNDPTPSPLTTPTSIAVQTSSVPTLTYSTPAVGGPAEQAATVDALLGASVASRQKLTAALQQIHKCQGLAQATDDLRTVGDERESQLAQLAGLDLSALPDAERLRALLHDALTYSLHADRSYLRWADAITVGFCPNSGAQYRDDGDHESDLAGQSKIQFLVLWNPIAADQGLPTRNRADI